VTQRPQEVGAPPAMNVETEPQASVTSSVPKLPNEVTFFVSRRTMKDFLAGSCATFGEAPARQLRRAGVAESVIMATGGWLTASIFRRYAIVSDADQRQAVEMLEQRRRETATQANAVEPTHDVATEPAHGVN
jgi:hypothetical protein